MSKKFLSVIIAVVMVVATMIPMMTAFAAIAEPVADESVWDTIDENGVYVSADGGFKFTVAPTWSYYGPYGITLTSDGASPYGASAATIAVYGPGSGSVDSDAVFESKSADSFKSTLQEDLIVFEKQTVGDGHTMYYSKTNSYECYVFQANGTKYFINFMAARGYTRDEFTDFVKGVMATIVIAGDSTGEEPGEDEPVSNTYVFNRVSVDLPEGYVVNEDADTGIAIAVPEEKTNGDIDNTILFTYIPLEDIEADEEAEVAEVAEEQDLEGIDFSDIAAQLGVDDVTVGEPQELEIDGYPAVLVTVSATVDGETANATAYAITHEDGIVIIVFVSTDDETEAAFAQAAETLKVLPAEVDPVDPVTPEEPIENPDTGDSSFVMFYALVGIAALAFIVVVATKKSAKAK